MARIRSFKPEIIDDEALGSCSVGAQLLYDRLITQADDDGRFRASPVLLSSKLFPYRPEVDPPTVEKWLEELENSGVLELYAVRGQRFVRLSGWGKHQRIDNAGKPLYPGPDEADSIPGQVVFAEKSASRGESRRTAAGVESIQESIQEQALALEGTEPDNVQKVWDAHIGSTGRNGNYRLDAPRRKLIRDALKAYPVEDVIDAVCGWVNDPWPERKNRNELKYLLKTSDQIEKFRDLKRAVKPTVVESAAAKAMRQRRERARAIAQECLDQGRLIGEATYEHQDLSDLIAEEWRSLQRVTAVR